MHKWDSLSKPERAKLLKSAGPPTGLPTGLSQLKWSGLQKSERKKIEKASKGSGWYEKAKPTRTHKGIKEVAPRHYEVSAKKEAESALNVPMQKKDPLEQARIFAKEHGYTLITLKNHKKGYLYRIQNEKDRMYAFNIDEIYALIKNAVEFRKNSVRKEHKPTLLESNISFDPAFEKSESERMMDERRWEEGTYEDIVVPYDTGDVGKMRQEAGIAETYNKMPEDWFTADRQKEWEKHEVEGYEGDVIIRNNQTKPYGYYIKTYPLAMEWVSKHFKKVTSAKEMEEAVSFYFGNDWKQFEEFLQEKQEEIATQLFEKEQKAQERKKQLESRYFTTKFRDIDDRNKTECVERFPVQKAHPFTHRGISLFAHKDGKEWKVTEVTTGLDIIRAHQFKGKWQNNSKDEIIQTAKEFIDEKTPEKVSELIKYAADTISRTSPCSQVSG